jgi:hypothetical protein
VAHPWHPGHDTTLTPASPWTDRPMCHSLATPPGHRRATHAPAWPSLARRPLLRRGVGHVVTNGALREALGEVRQRGGELSAKTLGYWLRAHKDRRSGDLVLRYAGCPHQSAKWFVAGFGVAADERFTAVLNSITKAAAVQCGVPHPPTDRGGRDRRPRAEGGVHEEVS